MESTCLFSRLTIQEMLLESMLSEMMESMRRYTSMSTT
nr:MAG TPA: hypothetical protein [Caudoviricetes sp.]